MINFYDECNYTSYCLSVHLFKDNCPQRVPFLLWIWEAAETKPAGEKSLSVVHGSGEAENNCVQNLQFLLTWEGLQ